MEMNMVMSEMMTTRQQMYFMTYPLDKHLKWANGWKVFFPNQFPISKISESFSFESSTDVMSFDELLVQFIVSVYLSKHADQEVTHLVAVYRQSPDLKMGHIPFKLQHTDSPKTCGQEKKVAMKMILRQGMTQRDVTPMIKVQVASISSWPSFFLPT
uniref:Uncharacterized protein n=1 Tax=Daphnia galeata TaxID=27404 RepID=A0A8J2RMY7_9CRUS|nr:unnamed protein product [Daphnia galeata]